MIMRLVREMRGAGRTDASIADAAEVEHSILCKSGAKVTSVYLSVATERIKSLSNFLKQNNEDEHQESQRKESISEESLLALLASKKQLLEYFFPQEALIPEEASNLFENLDSPRMCRRCGAQFVPNRQAEAEEVIDCRFHSGRQERIGGLRVYGCCHSSSNESAGCSSAAFHVHEGRKAARRGEEILKFLRLNTINQSNPTTQSTTTQSQSTTAIALDAEMFYTRGGYEASRLTLVDFFSEAVLLDCLLLPRHGPVLDYNTRFSGISAEMYDQQDTGLKVFSFAHVRQLLTQIIKPETILIGHSLDNDLGVLEVIK
jgi:RNA exonuclease 1